MRHHKIQKSNKHKKLKVVSASNWSDDDEEDNQQPKQKDFQSGNPAKLKKKNIRTKRDIEKSKLVQNVPKRVKELFDSDSSSKKRNKNKFKNEPGLLSKLNQLDSEDEIVAKPGEDESGAVRDIKLRPESIKQGPYETNEQFLRRLNKLANNAKFEAVIEERFNVDLCPKLEGLPRKPQILSTVDGSVYDEEKERKQNKKTKNGEEEPVPNKVLKRRLRDQKRKLKKRKHKTGTSSGDQEDGLTFEDYTDDVEFGDVAQRPPALAKFKRTKRS